MEIGFGTAVKLGFGFTFGCLAFTVLAVLLYALVVNLKNL